MTTLAKPFVEPRITSRATAAVPTIGDIPWLVGYALAFLAAHHLAAEWGGRGYYSLLYPAAGFRIALLWRRGSRLTLAVVMTEILVQLGTGIIDPRSAEWPTALIGVIRPPFVYGLVVMLVQRMADRARTSMSVAPMPLGLASVAAPATAAFTALPWS
ncbi:MAG: sensor histidine kinase, partial [Lysobacteraceae bacterium]